MSKAAPGRNGSVLDRWARFSHRHRGRIIACWILGLAVMAGLLFSVGGKFQDSFSLPGAEAQKGVDLLKERFPQQAGDTADVVFEADKGVNDPAVRQRIEALFAEIRAVPGVTEIESPYDKPAFIAPGGTIARAVVRWEKQASNTPTKAIEQFIDATERANGDGLRVEPGGRPVFRVERPHFGSEAVGLMAAIVILFLAFGSLMAMGLPIAAALFGIGMGAAIVGLLANVFGFPSWTTQFMAMIGIGVGIDYSLLVVTRFREGLHHGLEVEEAIAVAVTTAGRSVIFAGVVVAIAFFGLWAMGIPFIAAVGTGAAIVVAVAVLVAITLMPALMSLIGRRIDRLHVPFLHSTEGVDYASGWYRLSRNIQKRPLPFLIAGVAALLVLAAPVLDMQLGFTDSGNRPTTFHTRRAYDLLAKGFGKGFNGPLQVVLDLRGGGIDQLGPLQQSVAATDNVATTFAPLVNGPKDTAVLQVIPKSAPQATETSDLVHRLRDDVLPAALAGTGGKAYVSGFSAANIDIQDRITSRLPLLFAGVIGLSFLLLMAVFRSLLVAVKAAIMNLLSIGAAYGVVVAIFQWGWGKEIVGIDTGPVEVFLPMMFFAILFGLSMDYEVFLISRIREIYVKNGDNATAVAEGLAATARVISAAAAIMVAVFLAFVLGDDRVIKEMGIGLATAIFVDATVVRLILVPATMELLGNANWWLPGWLDRILPEIHIEASHILDAPVAPAAGGGAK